MTPDRGSADSGRCSRRRLRGRPGATTGALPPRRRRPAGDRRRRGRARSTALSSDERARDRRRAGRRSRRDHELTWHQDADGLSVASRPRAGDFDDDRIGIAVYRIAFDDAERRSELFAPTDPRTDRRSRPLLADARPGDIVQLGDGTTGDPPTVPPASYSADSARLGRRSRSVPAPPTSIVPDGPVLTVGRNAGSNTSGSPDGRRDPTCSPVRSSRSPTTSSPCSAASSTAP